MQHYKEEEKQNLHFVYYIFIILPPVLIHSIINLTVYVALSPKVVTLLVIGLVCINKTFQFSYCCIFYFFFYIPREQKVLLGYNWSCNLYSAQAQIAVLVFFSFAALLLLFALDFFISYLP